MRSPSRRRQRGAVILTVALLLTFLLGFMGIAIDFSHAFVVQSELQTAMDSCALSAAQELDGADDAITRATSAGKAAGNANRVQMQSVTWDGQAKIVDAEITFRKANYDVTTDPKLARYARCAHQQPNIQKWLMGAMALFSSSSSAWNQPLTVGARAVATRESAQSTCPVPLALKPKSWSDTAANNYGFSVGEWVTLLMGPGAATNGQIGWANLDGSNSASETVAEMNGKCGTKVGDTLGTPGVQSSVADVWNYRFGIYRNTADPSVLNQRPDYTGYAYTGTNWPAQQNAFDGPTPAGVATAENFKAKRLAFASCADTGTQLHGGATSCEGITNLTLNSFQKLAVPGLVAGGHWQYGRSRRLVLVPVVTAAMSVQDYACMLMLQPLSIPLVPVQLEFRGLASNPTSPCTTGGLPGGTAGPLVPVLVE